MPKEKVVVAMSGGVDSAVAACLLKEAGYEVVGVTFQLYDCQRIARGCCSAADRQDARQVCEKLGLAHLTLDYRLAFERFVIRPFIKSYLEGTTPNPCVWCNQHIKFAALKEARQRLKADKMATGHYAQIEKSEDGLFHLLSSPNRQKDQSYTLFNLTQEELSSLLFPVGNFSKEAIRQLARRQDLGVQDKSESQEICFIPDDDYPGFIEGEAKNQLSGPGNFVDRQGNVLGRHVGIHHYTIGQRRGLGLSFCKRTYVVQIKAEKNEVVLGTDAELFQNEMLVGEINWINPARPAADANLKTMIRYRHSPAASVVDSVASDRVRVKFKEPQRAVTPGQAAVFYQGEEVFGGGIIA